MDFHRTNCPSCDLFIGYPNVRKAEAMQPDLARHYADVVADAERRGVKSKLDKLEAFLAGSVATINVRPSSLLNMTLGTAYRSYHRALDQSLRRIAEEKYHAHRAAVDAKIHPGYGPEIVNAALSPDGRGLTNYGEVTLRLREISIGHRSSVLRENAFAFYERHDLGRRDAAEEPGWRAVWADRARLGVAHVGPMITSAIADRDLPLQILTVGADRDGDRYLEVHIYGEVDCFALEDVSLDQPLTTAESRDDWAVARRKLERRSTPVRDAVSP